MSRMTRRHLQPGLFGQQQADELAAQINALPDAQPQTLRLFSAGVPTAVAMMVAEAMWESRVFRVKEIAAARWLSELTNIGVDQAVAVKIPTHSTQLRFSNAPKRRRTWR